ncbi:MAG: hypothetical protein ACJATI_003381 [Halioglobus sp.]|jgi:hypothetical protein
MPEHQLIEINENIAKRNIFSVEEFSEWAHLWIQIKKPHRNEAVSLYYSH